MCQGPSQAPKSNDFFFCSVCGGVISLIGLQPPGGALEARQSQEIKFRTLHVLKLAKLSPWAHE